MPARPQRLDEDALRSAAAQELIAGRQWIQEVIQPERETNLEYYHLKPFGNEVEGRSQVVTADVREVVESMLPDLVRLFTESDEVVQFQPTGPEDVEVAKQASDYINFVYLRQNDGFLLTYTAVKDALREKTGWHKVFADESESVEEEVYEGKTEIELTLLLTTDSDDELELIESTENEPEQEGEESTFDVRVRRTKRRAKIRVVAVPNEEMVVSREAKDSDTARFIAHSRPLTRGELVEMGFEIDRVAEVPLAQADLDELGSARDRIQESQSKEEEASDWSQERVEVSECYLRVDADGDGIAELHQIFLGGHEGGILLQDETVDMQPFVSYSPILEPHRLIGSAVVDVVREVQLISSTVLRQFLDNLYRLNQGAYVAIEGQVEMDDLLSATPARVIRATNPAAVTPLPIPEFGRNIPFAMEFMQQKKEQWTGQSRLSQGQDAQAFGKTAFGTNALLAAGQKRIELVARVLSEVGFKRLFRKLLRLVVKHATRPQIVRLRNRWVPIDPNSWNEEMDVTVHVGLAIEGRQAMTQQLLAILDRQIQILAGGGAGVLVTPQNIHETLIRLTQNLGFQDAAAFWTDPSQAQPQPEAPDPKLVDIEMKREQKEKDRQLKLVKEMLSDDRARAELGIRSLEFIEEEPRGQGGAGPSGPAAVR